MDRLNNAGPTIDFTYELENKNTLPFLDISLIYNNSKLEFKVHYKSTNKNDHIHFHSHPKTKIKEEIIIGFYIKALRICIPKYLNKFDNIENSFS